MRESANILDLILAKRRLSERDRAFLEAVADGLDKIADRAPWRDVEIHYKWAVDAYNTTQEDG